MKCLPRKLKGISLLSTKQTQEQEIMNKKEYHIMITVNSTRYKSTFSYQQSFKLQMALKTRQLEISTILCNNFIEQLDIKLVRISHASQASVFIQAKLSYDPIQNIKNMLFMLYVLYACECWCQQRPEDRIRSLGAGVTCLFPPKVLGEFHYQAIKSILQVSKHILSYEIY